jgi:hypothetical protein
MKSLRALFTITLRWLLSIGAQDTPKASAATDTSQHDSAFVSITCM